ncbi:MULTISPECIES: hypothetical protein [Methylomonas]|uniref:Uncharacterized protein n=1 Tax=Methylomonas methanica TaxID=421 RepID=A0A177MNW8_METMH|nr:MULTISPECIES: hypothetical protein [Methylomonas]OAI07013.1 hypothetical protein A1353_08280 [Methylomonas methanica]PKM13656.1 MAG: hypothetical protein CVV13_00110 [Gammaproteobacteria bacterium HGW-Gammaproteobacteria-3]QBC26618.1 hypothetical protein U737_06660 [Methylomonas sp. LW13]
MKSKSLAIHCLVSLVCGTACTSLNRPDAAVSETVIESIVPIQPEQPWRLDNAWQTGGLGGSVLRAAAMEHVVRQVDQPFGVYVANDDVAGHVLNISTFHFPDSPDDDARVIERAWRKYCHHQLDMTPEEQALVKTMPIPHNVLSHGCNPGSLKK